MRNTEQKLIGDICIMKRGFLISDYVYQMRLVSIHGFESAKLYDLKPVKSYNKSFSNEKFPYNGEDLKRITVRFRTYKECKR